MSARFLTEGYATITAPGTTKTGTMVFSGPFSAPTSYVLNQTGDTYTLYVGPVMGIAATAGNLTSPNTLGITTTIIQPIPLISSDGTTASPATGIFMITDTTITVYSSITGNSFNQDTTNQQGWQNGVVINFSI
jgi:hypothetical protein